ncbi:Dabb family protein [Streptomyces sp. B-S-A8]|uniref:Dabb family protein n=1 Tax=Streptomyces solicavernae TaxID=3043614 RepID=A0ABT6RK68_9ACTN|nr:Dabb family protein [Streptomyces sp. B-S-A8]MDI3384826.1 Dabb family protein [Streptomyces sp. B-S-A8]
MIAHVVLYRYPETMSETDRERFRKELAEATRSTGVVERFTAGRHVPLPADDAATESLYSVAARWEFTDLEQLRAFSVHPAMSGVVDAWVRRLGIGVAFANTADEEHEVWT